MMAANSSLARLDHATKNRKVPTGLPATTTYQAPTSQEAMFVALKTKSRFSF